MLRDVVDRDWFGSACCFSDPAERQRVPWWVRFEPLARKDLFVDPDPCLGQFRRIRFNCIALRENSWGPQPAAIWCRGGGKLAQIRHTLLSCRRSDFSSYE
jgi:hypothetical protein